MPTVAQFVFPTEEVALTDTFRQLSEARATLEKSVATCSDAVVRLWVAADSEQAVRDALADDPSVEEFQLIAAEDDQRWLFDVDLGPSVELLQSVLLAGVGVVEDVVGRDGRWFVTCRYADHESLGEVRDLLDARSFQYDVARVQQVSETTSEGANLSENQYTALACACRNGYFEVPRNATLADVADELGISHQALSERLRRGLASYLESEFPVEEAEADLEPQVH